MEEKNDKKRKAVVSPVQELSAKKFIKKSKRLAQKEKKRMSENESRSRTPSGTNLENAVQDIRGFFSPNHIQKKKIPLKITKGRSSQPTKQHSTKTGLKATSAKGRSVNRKLSTQDEHDEGGVAADHECVNSSQDDSNWEEVSSSEGENDEGAERCDNSQLQDQRHFNSKMSTLLETFCQDDTYIKGNENVLHNTQSYDTQMERNDAENPRSIPITAVMEMFRQIKQEITRDRDNEIKSMKKEVNEFKTNCVSQAKAHIESIIQDEIKHCEKARSEVNYWKLKTETLTEVCNRMNTEMADLCTRVENLELNNSKRMVLVTGLETPEGKKKDLTGFMNEFLSKAVGVSVIIDDCFTLGVLKPKPVVLVLPNIESKREIMRNKKNLQNLSQKIYINDYLPPTTNEKRRRESDIVKDLQEQGQKEKATYSKGGFCINGRPYRKKIEPPTPSQMVNLEPDELQYILEKRIRTGPEVTEDNSSFIGYMAKVQCHEDVHDLYVKVKMMQPNARHVVCAYWVKDSEVCYAKDYHDDGEPGAGKQVLQILKENMLEDTVLFVARKYGGIKMGANRFICYKKAASLAIGLRAESLSPAERHGNRSDDAVMKRSTKSPSTHSYRPPQSNRGHTQQKQVPSMQGYQRGRGNGRGSRGHNNVRGARSSPSYSTAVQNTSRPQSRYNMEKDSFVANLLEKYAQKSRNYMAGNNIQNQRAVPNPVRSPNHLDNEQRMDFAFSDPTSVQYEEWSQQNTGQWSNSA